LNSAIFVAGLSFTACGKSGDAPPGEAAEAPKTCGPLKVSVDGQELTGLVHGKAIFNKTAGKKTPQVDVFNHDKVTCAELTNIKGRQVADGEVAVRAFAGGSGSFGMGVGFGSHTQMGVNVDILSKMPEKDGDLVALCVKETTFSPTMGDHKGKSVTVSGKFEGAYCGVLDFDAK